jgi:hypothetical protein
MKEKEKTISVSKDVRLKLSKLPEGGTTISEEQRASDRTWKATGRNITVYDNIKTEVIAILQD